MAPFVIAFGDLFFPPRIPANETVNNFQQRSYIDQFVLTADKQFLQQYERNLKGQGEDEGHHVGGGSDANEDWNLK